MTPSLAASLLPQPSHQELALRVREQVIRMAIGGGCFLGASLSCVDLLVYLYRSVLQVAPGTLSHPERDYVPALYGTLAELGFFPRERLRNHLKAYDSIYWHPNRAVPGVEFHSGSLGHLLSVGIGVAIDIRLRGTNNRVFVLLGDGELDEGSIWEGLLVASARSLDNLVLVVDHNAFQANLRTEDLLPLEPLAEKLEAFGCAVETVDGHDFSSLERAFAQLPLRRRHPTAIIAKTTRGKGLPSIEARADRWFVDLTPRGVECLLEELHGGALAASSSDPLFVR